MRPRRACLSGLLGILLLACGIDADARHTFDLQATRSGDTGDVSQGPQANGLQTLRVGQLVLSTDGHLVIAADAARRQFEVFRLSPDPARVLERQGSFDIAVDRDAALGLVCPAPCTPAPVTAPPMRVP